MKKFAVFDIDGTLIRWQLYHAVVDKLAKQGLLEADSHEQIHQSRMRWKNRESNYNFRDYEIELITQFEKSIQKLNPVDFDTAVEEVITEYRDQTYTYTKKLMRSLKPRGYVLLAISGSQQELVEKIADYYGFDACLGTTYQKRSENYTGEKDFPGADKKSALKKLIKQFDLDLHDSYAVGDSKSDAAMLELVENPIAFNPDEDLYEIAVQNHWPMVIERKNMIYRLEYKNGSYILATTN